MADMIEKYTDVDAILELMEGSEDLDSSDTSVKHDEMSETGITLVVAKDEAFCFYYKENIEAFEKRGVKIVYFSPLHDEKIPEGVSALLLGGGYPEQYAKELSGNTSMLESIKNALDCGLPCIAECGGFMYLHESIKTKDGDVYPLAGVLDATVEYTGHLVRFGYFSISECSSFKGLAGMKGHEFHYFDSTENGEDALLEKTSTGKKYSAMIVDGRRVMGYPHLYYNSSPEFVDEFIRVMKGEK